MSEKAARSEQEGSAVYWPENGNVILYKENYFKPAQILLYKITLNKFTYLKQLLNLCGRYNWTNYLVDEGESINLADVKKGQHGLSRKVIVYLNLWTGT